MHLFQSAELSHRGGIKRHGNFAAADTSSGDLEAVQGAVTEQVIPDTRLLTQQILAAVDGDSVDDL